MIVPALSCIKIDVRNIHYAIEGKVLYDKSKILLMQYSEEEKILTRSPHSLQKVVVHAFFQDNYLKSVELPDTLKVNRHFRFWILQRTGTHHLQSLSPCKNQHRTPSIFWWKCQRMCSLCEKTHLKSIKKVKNGYITLEGIS